MRLLKTAVATVVAASVLAFTTSAFGDLTFTGTGTGANAGLKASVTFSDVGGDLIVTLKNTATAGTTTSPSSLLTALFFTMGTTPAFSSGSVSSHGDVWDYIPEVKVKGQVITPGHWTTLSGQDVGAYWEYKSGLSGAPNGQNVGISSTGLNIFDKNGNLTTGTPGALDGPPWGISAGEPADVQDMQVNSPVVANQIVFDLKGLGGLLGTISNVGFQYGTSTSEPYIPGTPTGGTPVPEPTTILSGALLLLPFGASMARIVRRKGAA